MTRGVGGHGPANIMKHLGGLSFPASKQDIVNHAKNGQGPATDEVVAVLNKIDDREYLEMPEVLQEIGKVE